MMTTGLPLLPTCGGVRAEHRDAVDPGGEGAHGAVAVLLGAGEHEHDALLELGGPGLEADEQLGVVGAGQLGQHQAVGVVVAHGQAAGGAGGQVVELRRRRRAPCGVVRSDTTGDPWSTRDTVAMETPASVGDGVDRRPSRVRHR